MIYYQILGLCNRYGYRGRPHGGGGCAVHSFLALHIRSGGAPESRWHVSARAARMRLADATGNINCTTAHSVTCNQIITHTTRLRCCCCRSRAQAGAGAAASATGAVGAAAAAATATCQCATTSSAGAGGAASCVTANSGSSATVNGGSGTPRRAGATRSTVDGDAAPLPSCAGVLAAVDKAPWR